MARPSKLTPEIQVKICDAIRHGATYWAAAESSGIAYSTLNQWMTKPGKKYEEFLEAIKRANADAQLDLLAKIQAATRTDWRAASWILERRFRNDFGAAIDVTSGDKPLQFDYAKFINSASRPTEDSDPPGEDQDSLHGEAVGQDGDGGSPGK